MSSTLIVFVMGTTFLFSGLVYAVMCVLADTKENISLAGIAMASGFFLIAVAYLMFMLPE